MKRATAAKIEGCRPMSRAPRTLYSDRFDQRVTKRAPTARYIKAQGKREARRPGLPTSKRYQGLKGRHNPRAITPFQGWNLLLIATRGDALRFASRLPLAVISRAVGAKHIASFLAVISRAVGAKHIASFLAVISRAVGAPFRLLRQSFKPTPHIQTRSFFLGLDYPRRRS